MLDSDKKIIINKFEKLVKCDVRKLAEKMLEKNIFTPLEIQQIFSSTNDRHNRRKFFFDIQKKDTNAFQELVTALREIGEGSLAGNLYYKRRGAEAIDPYNINEVPPLTPITKSGSKSSPLNIQVVQSREFFDTQEHNKALTFYKTRSRARGRVLIINNYKFDEPEAAPEREGAEIDDINLKALFYQIGCDVEHYINKTKEEMLNVINTFAQNTSEADICFVIIMSHGTNRNNHTYVYGKDMRMIRATDIIDEFTNQRCKTFFGKPKVFLFQVCRGRDRDTLVSKQTDGAQVFTFENIEKDTEKEYGRTYSDILIGNATVTGYTAHRDCDSGTWYIEAFCKVLQTHAFEYSLEDMLSIVDDLVKKRRSENGTVQTPEMVNWGFKKLYLHPGIYMNSDGNIEQIRNAIN